MTTPQEVLHFWLEEVGEDGWYRGGAELDALCAARFEVACDRARNGAFRDWLSRPESALAYLILTDQLPRNIYRGTALAFHADPLAQSGARLAIARGHDLRIAGTPRQFFYMPFEHAENRQAQSLSVCLFLTRMPGDPGDNLVHARAHREIIRRFGRFPSRNAALNRVSSPAEERFLAEEGYAGVVERLKAA
ncbi:MAG: DUF924 domain-containing protein [Rhodobacteraceae bacterium]|nr:DUF924 domain-containing protein [Paracoccaceae bacterium]